MSEATAKRGPQHRYVPANQYSGAVTNVDVQLTFSMATVDEHGEQLLDQQVTVIMPIEAFRHAQAAIAAQPLPEPGQTATH